MSTKVHHQLSGSNELRALLDVITNADKYSKLLDALELAQADAVKAIELVGPAEQISSLLEVAKREKTSADAILSEAHLEVSSILSDAKRDALLTKQDAKTAIEEKLGALNTKLDAVRKREIATGSLEKALAGKIAALNTREADANSLYQKALKLQKELLAKKSALGKLLGG